ncbi:hypothetical protein N7528_001632 [Penicillium herquei]|nr:hypothetical protein N7528_001632 [Penicillium herquei]
MAHCLSCLNCFRKKSDTGVDADAPPQPRPNDNRDKANERKIAPPANIVPLETNIASRTKNDPESDHIDGCEGQSEETPEKKPSLDPRLKAETRAGFRNLWDVAAQQLDERYKKWLKCEDSSLTNDVIKKIQSEAKESYKQNEKQELGAREKKEGSFDARAKLKNLLGFTFQVQDLITAGLSLDTTGYDIERHELVMSASEYLAGVLSYYTIIDGSYRLQYTQANERLEDALVEVYVAILKYAAEVEKAKEESPGRRFCNNITALVDDPLTNFKACIDSMKGVVNEWKSLVRDEDVIRGLKEISSRARGDEELKILDWLSATHYSKPQNDKQRNRSSNTGNWILESKVYVDWKATPGELLWLRGAAPQLSMTLSNTVERHSVMLTHTGTLTSVTRRHNTLRTWLDVFSVSSRPIRYQASCKNGGMITEKNKEPGYARLLDALHSVIQNLPGDLFVVFDALDECPQEPKRERDSLLRFIEDLMKKHQEKLHLLATSRPEPDVLEKLQNYRAFDLEAHLGEDVEKFVKTQLKHGKLKRWQSAKQPILESIENRLLDIPERSASGLEDPHLAQLLSRAADAAVTIDAENIIRLAHFSVKEFLISEYARKEVSLFYLSAQPAHGLILERLLAEIHEYSNVRLNEFNSENKPLLDYAARFWDGHMKEFCESTPPGDLQETIDHIFLHQQCYANWIRLRDSLGFERWYMPSSDFHTPLAMASGLGLKQTAKILLEKGEVPNYAKDRCLIEAYEFAAEEGHLTLLAMLLEAPWKSRFTSNILLHLIDDSKEGKAALEIIITKLWNLGVLVDLQADGTGQIHDWVGFHAAGNAKCGFTLFTLLLGRTGFGMKFNLNSFLCGAARSFHPNEILRLVLDQLDDGTGSLGDDEFDELANAITDPEIARLWFQVIMRPDYWESNHIHRLARNLNLELMEIFLEIWGHEIVITDDILIAAAKNRRDSKIFGVFLQSKLPETLISDEVFCAAAGNRPQGPSIFKAALNSCAPDRLIGDDIILKIIDLREGGTNILEELFRRKQAVSVSERVLLDAAWRGNLNYFQLLVAIGGLHISITEKMLIHALSGNGLRSGTESHSLTEYVIGLLGPDYLVTEEVLIHAARSTRISQSTMSLLLDRSFSSVIPESVFINAYDNPLVLETLLERTQNEAPVQSIMQRIANDCDHRHAGGGDVLQVLIRRGLVSVNEQLVESFAEHESALEVISIENPMVKCTQRAFEMTKRFDCIRILLKFKNSDFSVSDDFVKILISSGYAVNSYDYPERTLRLLLDRFESKMPITEEILLHAANSCRYPEEMIRLFLDERRPLDLQAFWESLWISCCDSSEEVSDILLEYTALEISQRMLERVSNSEPLISSTDSSDDQRSFEPGETSGSGSTSYPGSTSDLEITSDLKRTSDLENTSDLEILGWIEAQYELIDITHDFLARLVWFLVERNFTVPQDFMSIIVEKGHLKTIAVVFYHNPHIIVTDEILIAAKKNPDYYDITWFLSMFSEPPKTVEDPNHAGHMIHWPQDLRKCHLSSCRVMHSVDERYERCKRYERTRWPSRFGLWTV